ncbi:MAG: universal stress protein [Microbacterium arborescens]
MAELHSVDDEHALPRTPVIVGVIPGQSPRVVVEAARYAGMLGVGLVVAHVDVTRFVTYEDPDGYVHTAPIDLGAVSSASQLEEIRAAASEALATSAVDWAVHQLVGDPALAIKHLADRLDARLLVVGTRRRGLGESIREFFTGSVAARLAHRQQRPVLVVPQGQVVPDDEDLWPIP